MSNQLTLAWARSLAVGVSCWLNRSGCWNGPWSCVWWKDPYTTEHGGHILCRRSETCAFHLHLRCCCCFTWNTPTQIHLMAMLILTVQPLHHDSCFKSLINIDLSDHVHCIEKTASGYTHWCVMDISVWSLQLWLSALWKSTAELRVKSV